MGLIKWARKLADRAKRDFDGFHHELIPYTLRLDWWFGWLGQRLVRQFCPDRVLWFLALSAVILWLASFFQLDGRAAVSATAAAVPAALAAIVWTFRQHLETTRDQETQRQLERCQAQSAFYLESWKDGVERAHALLIDGNNNRVIWLTAARILVRCEKIEVSITEPHHRVILERFKDEWRLRFSRVLGYENPKVTASFFYGATPETPTDQAAILSRADSMALPALAEASIRVVWEFAKFPHSYEDLIRGIEFTVEEKGRLWMTLPDLCEWLAHIDRYTSDGRRLIELSHPDRPIENTNPEAAEMIAKRNNRTKYRIGEKRDCGK